jgi:glutamate-1-semialdehyde 2,1-aminomutase
MNLSKQLFDHSKTIMPGGVNSPVRAFGAVKMDPPFIDQAMGCKIIDVDGHEYIDFVGSWGPLILGHTHPKVQEAISIAIKKGTSFGAPTKTENQLVEKIIEMVPSIEMVRLVNSGTEATMSAIRLARGFTGRNKIVKFEGCYHGHADSFLIKAGSGALTLSEPDSAGVPSDFAKNTLIAQFNDLESVQQLFKNHKDTIAAVIVEPIAGNMGVIPPKSGFLEGLRDLCDTFHSLLIFDEVITGFRVHPGGAQALYSVYPDLTAMGKVIGGGLPLAAYGGKKSIMEKIAPSGPVYQAGTLSGNPVAATAGLKTLELICAPGYFENLNQQATFFFESCKEIIEENQWPLSLNYVNSMGCLFFKAGGVPNFFEAMQSDTSKFAEYFRKLHDAGIYIAPSQFETMFISSAHSKELLKHTLVVLKKSLSEIFDS